MTPQVFVIAPFGPEQTAVHDVVRRAVAEAGLDPVTIDPVSSEPGAALAASTLRGIRRADIVIADITGQNGNVLFELGYAYSLGKPTILLISFDSRSGVPSDLVGFTVIGYYPDNLAKLSDIVRSELHGLSRRLRRSA